MTMEKYSLDHRKLSLGRFYELIRSKKLIPSRMALQEYIEERFRLLEKLGIENLDQLIRALSNENKIRQVASSTGIPVEILVLLKREAGSYMAKPFPLSRLPGIPLEFTEVLKSKGIRNTRDFFEEVQTSGQRKQVSKSTGIPESRLKEIHCLCDLSRITGVGALFTRIIYEAGVRSTEEFASIHANNFNASSPLKELAEDDLQYCIDYAKVILEMRPES